MDRWVKLLATFFYAGEMPVAPGTVGSFVGLLIFLSAAPSPGVCAGLFVLISGLVFFSAGRAEKIFQKKDPHEVVIDEVAGIFPAFFMIPLGLMNLIVGFLLYRALDIAKPFPARRLEHLEGSYGIMADDLVCGIYTNLILHILLKLNILH